jgi:hypothetical protein
MYSHVHPCTSMTEYFVFGPNMVRSSSNRVYIHRHCTLHCRCNSQLGLHFVFFARDLRAQGLRWALPGVGQMRAVGQQIVRSSSNCWYIHLPRGLHRCHPANQISITLLWYSVNYECTAVYSRAHPLRNLLFQRLSIPLRSPQTPGPPCEFGSIESTVEPINKALTARLPNI